jgi:hypothetical protein
MPDRPQTIDEFMQVVRLNLTIYGGEDSLPGGLHGPLVESYQQDAVGKNPAISDGYREGPWISTKRPTGCLATPSKNF